MRPSINIEGGCGMGFGARRVRVTGFKSTFILARSWVEDTKFYNYVIMEETSNVVLVTAHTMHDVIYKLHKFLTPLEQYDIDLIIHEG